MTEMMSETQQPETFAYMLYTVTGRFRIVGQRMVYGTSAQAVCEEAIAAGHDEAEACPALPLNGAPAGLPVRRGDTASVKAQRA